MNEFETAVVNEPSVFEQLKFYCILYLWKDKIVEVVMLFFVSKEAIV